LQQLKQSAPLQWLWTGATRCARVLRPQTETWRNAAWGIVAAVAGVVLVHTIELIVNMPGSNPYALLVMAAIVVLPTLAVLVALSLLQGLLRLPVFFRIV